MAYRLPSSLSAPATTRPRRHHPSGFRGLRQATTKPTTPKGVKVHHSGPPVPEFTPTCARPANGHWAATRVTMTQPITSAEAGEANRRRRAGRPGTAGTAAGFPSLIPQTVRPERSGNVTAGGEARRRPRSAPWRGQLACASVLISFVLALISGGAR